MDPVTIIIIGGAVGALLWSRGASAATADVVSAEPPPPAEGPGAEETASAVGGAAASLGATAGAAAGIAVAVYGIAEAAEAIEERRHREDFRYDAYKAMQAIGAEIRKLDREALAGVADQDILAPLEVAASLPPGVTLAFTPTWERGCREIAQALAESRNALEAPETPGGPLPPWPIMFMGHPTIPYYRAKRGLRDGTDWSR